MRKWALRLHSEQDSDEQKDAEDPDQAGEDVESE